MKSIVVNYDNICAICGKPKECTHHLIFGSGVHELCNEDKVTIPMCNGCHNMQYTPFRTAQIHDNSMAEALSKMLGQVAWERHYMAMKLANNDEKMAREFEDMSRTAFMKRYSRSWL